MVLALLAFFFLPSRADGEAFRMDHAPLEAAGIRAAVRGQLMWALENPPAMLRGVPEGHGRRVVHFQAVLGDGDENIFDMVLVVPEDGTPARWIMDADQDGDLSNEESLAQESGQSGRLKFPPLDFAIFVGGKARPYRAALRVYADRERPYGYLETRCCRMGDLVMAGRSFEAILVDGNTNGCYGDTEPFEDDTLYIRSKGGGSRFLWQSSVKAVVHEGQWYYFEPAADGSSLRSKGMAERLAPLRTPFDTFSLDIHSPRSGCIHLTAKGGAVYLPPGDYTWTMYGVSFRDEQQKNWRLSCGTIMKVPFNVKDGDNRLELALPLRQHIQARIKGDEVTFEEQIKGRGGENVYVYTAKGRLQPPAFTVEDLEGNVAASSKFEAG
jgi:hypothetical protein